ncbi:MAG: EamA family transporter [Chloroflexi bacterium]|nr:EamA family transporter [Chloroflexota bacterium]
MTTQAKTQQAATTFNPAALFHLIVIYLVWGSTYLAIRIAVRPGAGFPPFSMALLRVLAAGGILLAWGWLSKQRLRPTRREAGVLLASGLLLWTGGNGLVTWAEQHAASGLTALLIGALPIYTAIIEAFIDRKRPSGFLFFSLLVGFGGITLLTLPSFTSGVRADVTSTLALLAAAVSWGFGSILQARNPVELGARVSSGYQMLAGGLGFTALTLLTGEPLPTPTPEAWLAWAYLVLIGAVLAYTSFVTALRLLPTNIVMTYAYVNPVIAVILGWVVLGETITGWTVAGSLLVLAGVAGVFRERYGKKKPAPAEG